MDQLTRDTGFAAYLMTVEPRTFLGIQSVDGRRCFFGFDLSKDQFKQHLQDYNNGTGQAPARELFGNEKALLRLIHMELEQHA